MRFKQVIFVLFISICAISHAQNITLEKMGALSTRTIYLGQKIKVTYKTDSVNFNYKGIVYKYEFPILYMKTQTDTLILDGRKINNLIYTSDLIPLNIFALFFTSDISVLLSIETFKTGNLTFFAGAIPAIILSGLLIDGFKTRLDTKNKWSFVNPKENK